MRTWALLLVVSSACASPAARVTTAASSAAVSSTQRYTVSATVLESPSHGPQLCLGLVADSLPPQCGGLDVTPWDWSTVAAKESVDGTTWGGYTLTGTYDGTTFHLTDPVRPIVRASPLIPGHEPPQSPCAVPPGGWRDTDPARTSEGDRDAVVSWARSLPDFAGAWLTWPDGVPQDDFSSHPPQKVSVVNVAFTGSLAEHRREAAERWGGPLCVTGAERTYASLQRAQDDLTAHDAEAKAAGVRVLSCNADEIRNVLEVRLVVADDAARRWLADRYGADALDVTAALTPV